MTTTRGLAWIGAAVMVMAVTDAGADDASYVVLVNKNNPISSMSRVELKRAVTGGIKQWDSGAVVQLGIIASDAPETQYLASMLDASPRELLSRIQEQVFKGEMRRPVTLHSSGECAAFARSNPGAVCVASSGQPVPPEAHTVSIR